MTKIITFEGIDGTGKGTQLKLMYEYLLSEGYQTGIIDFPNYSGFFGKQIGKYLSAKDGIPADRVDCRSMALWFAMDRFEAFRNLDYSGLDVLLINRYVLSNAVYQSIRDIDLEHPDDGFYNFIQALEYSVLGIPRPDMELIFDMDLDSASENIKKKGYRDYIGSGKDVYEAIPALQYRCREKYRKFAENNDNAVIIDCMEDNQLKPVEIIQNEIRRLVIALLQK